MLVQRLLLVPQRARSATLESFQLQEDHAPLALKEQCRWSLDRGLVNLVLPDMLLRPKANAKSATLVHSLLMEQHVWIAQKVK